MSERLRCVGGSYDGERLPVRDDLRLDEPVRLFDRASQPAAIWPLSAEALAAPVELHYVVYSLRLLNFAPDRQGDPPSRLRFLVPEDWTDEKAIRHIFERWGPR
jgi:hypothetical protein